MEHPATKERQLHMDLLRILACFSVVMLHSASQFWYILPVKSAEWLASNTYDAMFRFGVPIFVMLSGRFFLSAPGEVNIRKLYSKNILRLLTAFVMWSALYGIVDCAVWVNVDGGFAWESLVSEMFMGRYHLWYLPMLIGIYMILPILKTWITHCSKKNMEYLLIVFVVFKIGLDTLKIINFPAYVTQVFNQFYADLIGSNVGYFVLGYYLYRYPLGRKMQRVIYAGGLVGLIGAIGVSTLDTWMAGAPVATAFDSFSVFTFAVTVAIYVFFQEVIGKKNLQKGERLIKELSANTFGIYLMHILAIELLSKYNINTMSINIAFGIPLLAIVCFVVCGIAAAILRRIPFVGKYIC